MIVCGIDPGLEGGFAFLSTDTNKIVASFPIPTLSLERKRPGKKAGVRREISWDRLLVDLEANFIREYIRVDYAFVERVQSSPQMGVTSAFNFGRTYGGLEAFIACHRWPVEFVTPNSWKKALKVPANKDDAVRRANQLLPADTHRWTPIKGRMDKAQACGVAEAALIALYGSIWLAENLKQRVANNSFSRALPGPMPAYAAGQPSSEGKEPTRPKRLKLDDVTL